MRVCGLAQQVDRSHIDRGNCIEVVDRHLHDGLSAIDPGPVDENIEASHGSRGRLDEPHALIWLGNVRGER